MADESVRQYYDSVLDENGILKLKCQFCGYLCSTQTTPHRLRAHLVKEKGQGIRPCPYVSPPVMEMNKRRKRATGGVQPQPETMPLPNVTNFQPGQTSDAVINGVSAWSGSSNLHQPNPLLQPSTNLRQTNASASQCLPQQQHVTNPQHGVTYGAFYGLTPQVESSSYSQRIEDFGISTDDANQYPSPQPNPPTITDSVLSSESARDFGDFIQSLPVEPTNKEAPMTNCHPTMPSNLHQPNPLLQPSTNLRQTNASASQCLPQQQHVTNPQHGVTYGAFYGLTPQVESSSYSQRIEDFGISTDDANQYPSPQPNPPTTTDSVLSSESARDLAPMHLTEGMDGIGDFIQSLLVEPTNEEAPMTNCHPTMPSHPHLAHQKEIGHQNQFGERAGTTQATMPPNGNGTILQPERADQHEEVDIALAKGHELIKGADQEAPRLCFGGYGSKNCLSSSIFGKMVDECLNGLLAQKTTRDQFGVVVEEAPAELVAELPCNTTVGLETKLAEVWSCLEDKNVGIVGLYGIGGVGKTTLLTQIRNKFVDTCKDYLVIWIVVSKDCSPEKIQADIRKETGFSHERWSTNHIFNKLRKEKFILLLDDIWERFDLTKMGIPPRENLNGSKIIFTTRSLKVCGEMLAQRKIRVETLEREHAWELFQKYVGDDTINTDLQILPLAQDVASKCGGLPIALITIGRAMSCKTEPEEWHRAAQILKKPALHRHHIEDEVLNDMEVEVFSLLRFSYDNLPNDRVKSCFLYCALYPSDRLMYKDMLIDFWVCEDFVIDSYDVDAFSEGYSVMGTLVRSCLLEEEGQFVKLHDMIRDMALWIEKENVLVMTRMQLTEAPSAERWEGLTRLSLINNNIKNLTQVPRCSELKSLLLCENEELYDIHEDFFQSMGALVLLKLHDTGLDKLPRSVENLVSLRYLDISDTKIRRLPAELAKLTRLKHLDLSDLNLKAKRSLISSLSSLVVLKMNSCVYTYLEEEEEEEEEKEEEKEEEEEAEERDDEDDDYDSDDTNDDTLLLSKASVDGEMLLEELQCLKHLKKLTITLTSVSVLERLSVTDKLLSIIKGLVLKQFNGSEKLNISSLKNMKHLAELGIEECELDDILVDFTHNSSAILRDISFSSLRLVKVFSCNELKDLTWLILVPNLTTLVIQNCEEMEEIIDGVRFSDMTRHQNLKPFSKLSYLHLEYLLQLKSIHPNALPFPFLCEMFVFICPLLKKLPLDSNSREGRKIVLTAEKEWWEAIEWEDDATKAALSSRFKCTLH